MAYDPIHTSSVRLRIGKVSSGQIGAASYALEVHDPILTEADIGNPVSVFGAGAAGGILVTTIAGVSDDYHCSLSSAASESINFEGPGADVTIYREVEALEGSIKHTASLTVSDTLDFTIDGGIAESPEVGRPVLLTLVTDGVEDVADPIFGGSIESARRSNVTPEQVRSECGCVSWDIILSRRTTQHIGYGGPMWGYYGSPATSWRCGQIVKDLAATALNGDFVSVTAEDGAEVDLIVFDYCTLADALSQLARLSSNETDTYYFWVSPWRVLHFEKQTATAAPWGIDDRDGTDANIRYGVASTTSREKYTNRVIVTATQAIAAAVTEDRPGDGASRDFYVTSSIGLEPTITVNDGAPQSVGVYGDTGKQWYWSEGSNRVTQDAGETILTPSDTVSITYSGVTIGVEAWNNLPAMGERASVESSNGVYETVIAVTTPTTQAQMLALAEAIGRQNGQLSQSGEIITYRPGLKAGQLIPIHLSDVALDGSYLIDSASLTTGDNVCQWTAHFANGNTGDWRKAFADLVNNDTDTRGGGGIGNVSLVPFTRVFALSDTAVRDDAAHHQAIYLNRALTRVQGVLRKSITSDLTVRFNVVLDSSPRETHSLGEFTIPSTTPVDETIKFETFDYTNCPDGSVVYPDIVASDGSKDKDGVAGFTLIFSGSDTGYAKPSTAPGTVTNPSGSLTEDEPLFGAGGTGVKIGSRSGNTTAVVTTSGTHPAGDLGVWDASGNLISGGPPPAAVTPSNATPTADSGAGAAGTSAEYARGDHQHPASGGGAPADAHYLTTQAETGLSAEASLGALADNSIVAVDVAAGVATPRAAVAGDVTVLFSGAGDYLKSNGSKGTPGGSGDVVGPAGATDGYLAVFDGATGKLLKNGGPVPAGGGGDLTVPPLTGWSWDTQGTSTADVSSGKAISLMVAQRTSGSRLYVRAAPTAPYTIEATFRAAYPNDSALQFGFQDAGGKMVTWHIANNGNIYVFKFSSSAAAVAAYVTLANAMYLRTDICLLIQDTGTNIVFSYRNLSRQGAAIQLYSVSRTDYLAAPTKVFFGAYTNGGGPMPMDCINWVQS